MRSLCLFFLLLAVVAMVTVVWWRSSSGGPPPQAATAPGGPAPAAERSEPARAADGSVEESGRGAGAEAVRRMPAPPDPRHAFGRVLDHRGQPVAGATVACWRRGREHHNRAVTGADGAFRVAVPPGPEVLRLEIRAPAHLRRRVTQTVPEGGGDLAVGEVRLRPGAVLAGRVLEAGGGPVAGASVYRLGAMPRAAQRRSFENIAREQSRGGAVTDADGRFALEHARPGDFSLLVDHPDHPVAWLLDRSVQPGAVLDDLVVVLRRGSSIRGRIVGLERRRGEVAVLAWSLAGRGVVSGQLADAQARISGISPVDPLANVPDVRRIEVAGDGSFELGALRSDARFAIWALERDPVLVRAWRCSEQLEVSAGQAGVVLHYEAGTTVTFQVVDAATGEPVTRLSLTPRMRSGSGFLRALSTRTLARPVTCDHEGGRVTISGIRSEPSATLSLDVRARGYRRLRRGDIAIPASGTLDLGALPLEPRR